MTTERHQLDSSASSMRSRSQRRLAQTMGAIVARSSVIAEHRLESCLIAPVGELLPNARRCTLT
jgi:hypothetical protein